MKGLILAGGKSSRFNYINKCILPINGIPLIERNVQFMKNCGIIDIGIVVGENTYIDIIKNIGSGHNFGVKINYFFQDNDYGVPGAIVSTYNFVDNDCLVICGDNYIQCDDYKDFTLYKECVFGKNMSGNSIKSFAVLINGEFIEKPDSIEEGIDYFVFAGPFVVNKEHIKYMRDMEVGKRGEKDIVEVFNHFNFISRVYNGNWFDIGTPYNYSEAVFNLSK